MMERTHTWHDGKCYAVGSPALSALIRTRRSRLHQPQPNDLTRHETFFPVCPASSALYTGTMAGSSALLGLRSAQFGIEKQSEGGSEEPLRGQ